MNIKEILEKDKNKEYLSTKDLNLLYDLNDYNNLLYLVLNHVEQSKNYDELNLDDYECHIIEEKISSVQNYRKLINAVVCYKEIPFGVISITYEDDDDEYEPIDSYMYIIDMKKYIEFIEYIINQYNNDYNDEF